MLKGRAVTIKLERPVPEGEVENKPDNRSVEEKAEVVLYVIEKVASKIFMGMCVYILLDTRRQVAIAKAKRKG